MSKAQAERDLETRAKLFKALGNPTRLLVVNLIRIAPRHTEELASILKLSPGTVSHHLSTLTDAGLLNSKKEQYYQIYSLVKGVLNKSLADTVSMQQPNISQNVKTDAYRDKVLKTFFKHGRLKQIPTQRKKLVVVLEELIEAFELDRDYGEREVSLLIADYNDDFATLRRDLVDFGFLSRTKDGKVYRRNL